MKMKTKRLTRTASMIFLAAFSFMVFFFGRSAVTQNTHDHDQHNHAAHEEHGDHEDAQDDDGHAHEKEHTAHDDHEGHDHSRANHDAPSTCKHAACDHDHGDDNGLVKLTAQQQKRIGLRLEKAGGGTIAIRRSFPGEVMLNPDRLAHIVARAGGVVKEVHKTVGDRVKDGDVLAWLESSELATAKLNFYNTQAEVGCCLIEVPRAKEIFKNVTLLLQLLEKEPAVDDLKKVANLEMGEYRGKIITAYAEYVAAKEIYEQEKALRGKNISSKTDFIQAESQYKKAYAELVAARDTARYEVLVSYTEAVTNQQVIEFKAVAAEQNLRLLGVDKPVIELLRKMVPKTVGLKPCLCPDPDCKEGTFPSVLETLGKDKRFGWYPVRAPFSGIITEKHLTIGEKVDSEESVMAVADLSSVWIRFNIYQKDIPHIKPGLSVRIHPGKTARPHEAEISWVSPIIDRETRTAPARIVVENSNGSFRPGQYITVTANKGAIQALVVIQKSAVQVLDEETVVFIEKKHGFSPVPVRLGDSDTHHVIVLEGLEKGTRYVTEGAFELKAEIVTSGMDPHAGHGH